jgi:acetyl-CoA carboxylase carboxyltransferase component
MAEEFQDKTKQLDNLKMRRESVQQMGGAERIQSQKAKGKLTARERIDALLDDNTFRETGIFAKSRGEAQGIAADGVITGFGTIHGRKVYIYAQDFTSNGGTLGEIHAQKIANLLDAALKSGVPVVGLNDSGGARIQDGVDALAGFGKIFYRNTQASGVIPQICAILGPNAGGAVYSPALMDFIFMVKGISYAYITGPRVVKSVMAQEISDEELGGAVAAQKKAGVAARTENSESECFENIRSLFGFLPSNNREKPPRVDWGDTPDRIDSELFNVVPAESYRPYDMHKIISRVFDRKEDVSNYFELFPLFAPNIITCFSRLNGYSVGVIANNPMSKAGVLDIDASDKASRFIRFCDAFNIPLITFVDVPGYLPGTGQEWGGIIRHGAKMLYAYSEATVPKISVVIRKAIGGAFIGMCSRELGADFQFAWPSAELAVMGPEAAAPIIYKRELDSAENPEQLLKEKIREYREKTAVPYRAAEHLHIDDVIDPSVTRSRLIESLEMLLDKQETRPFKKHGIIPA